MWLGKYVTIKLKALVYVSRGKRGSLILAKPLGIGQEYIWSFSEKTIVVNFSIRPTIKLFLSVGE